MAPLTFADTHNIIAFLSKSDVSAGFDQIMDFLNSQVIHYALMVNPTSYVSCIKQFWATTSIKKTNDVVKLQALIDRKKVVVTEDIIQQYLRLDDIDGVEYLPTKDIFVELARMGYEKPPPKLTFYKAFLSAQWKSLIHILVQCVSAKRTAWIEFICSMASTVICLATVLINNQVYDTSSDTTKFTSPALTQKVFANIRRIGKGFSGVETPLFATMLVKPRVAVEEEDEEDEVRMHLKRGRIKAIDADEDITLVDMETKVELDVELQGRVERKDDDSAADKEVNADEPTVFNDEEMDRRLHEEEVEQAAAKENQEQDDFKRAQVLQQQKYQSLKRKPISIAQARKNIIVYLKNMAGYKIADFKGMTYDQVRPIFEREYNKVQTFLNPDRDEEPTKKRVAKEILL
nr:hypothetical protein [Tanacetum cinerariifolium]